MQKDKLKALLSEEFEDILYMKFLSMHGLIIVNTKEDIDYEEKAKFYKHYLAHCACIGATYANQHDTTLIY